MMTADVSCIRGRFAPSPSGPLHFGSLIAALGSYLNAKSRGGQWLVRMEDIDMPRMQPDADTQILQALEAAALEWDGAVVYQSQRHASYEQAQQLLQDAALLYACDCNRARLQQLGGVYDGYCAKRQLAWPNPQPVALRLNTGHAALACDAFFQDGVFGHVPIPPDIQHDHYSIRRRDGLFSYQLVVVVDDLLQGITEVVRGADLIEMTTRQQALWRWLAAPLAQTRLAPPHYAHLPLAVASAGFKLSKQNHAAALSPQQLPLLFSRALGVLGHMPPADLVGAPCWQQRDWALQHWQLSKVPKVREVLVPELA
jgi:glutamyl-Q tRNA(Asp) synthetase